ncbi:hypothetical protein GLOIN_2v1488408 [Rhizophagus irregularis DAOM 181602=DAOM 197198]|nr:hypothetical protein GLOIN_2v1488408 [Rhizophagus irregularis DAOM 181602=DAOM 197198]
MIPQFIPYNPNQVPISAFAKEDKTKRAEVDKPVDRPKNYWVIDGGENETPDQWQQRLERDRMSKRIKRASENAQQREKRLSNNRIDKLSNNFCPVCNECFPSIKIVQGERHHCHMERNEVKKFSAKKLDDVQEFATHLPHRPSSLDVLAVHHCSSDVRAFKDFNVLGSSLPENGPLDDQILRLL